MVLHRRSMCCSHVILRPCSTVKTSFILDGGGKRWDQVWRLYSASGLVAEYWTRTFRSWVRISPRSSASNLEQAANLLVLCAQVNSASYPLCDGKWVVAYGYRMKAYCGWLGVVVCLWAALRIQLCLLSRAIDGSITHHSIISSYQSAVTSKTVKHC